MTPRQFTNYIIVHCSATSPDQDIGAKTIKEWHTGKGWSDIGYHYVVRRNGKVERGRNVHMRGAHVKGHNHESVGICMVGGVNDDNEPEDNFTDEQYSALRAVLNTLKAFYPGAVIRGHRDFSPDLNNDGEITEDEWIKHCPCFEVSTFVRTL